METGRPRVSDDLPIHASMRLFQALNRLVCKMR
ncbi:hypothetical protein M2277_002093 [Paenibacillus sp. LBL]|nr:hypothetical protein [Paenibacillus sp. LBL]